MSDPTNAVQAAIYQALSSPSPAMDVYDNVPAGAGFPYISIDAHEAVQADYIGERMDIRYLYLTVWSDKAGKKEVQSLMARIDEALHRQKLPLTGDAKIVSLDVTRKRAVMDADGETYMGKVTLKIRTTH